MALTLVTAIYLLSVVLPRADGLRCYQCPLIDDPLKCHNTTRCQSNEVCFVTEAIDSDFDLTYRLGCVTEQGCSNIVRRSPNHSHRRSLAQQCCRTNFCNKGYPGLLTTKLTTPTTTTQTTTVKPTTPTRTTKHLIHTTQHHHVSTQTHSVDARCPRGRVLDDNCYVPSFQYGSQWKQVTRHDAYTFCRQHGMNLPSIHSPREETFIHRMVSAMLHTDNSHDIALWIGLQDIRWDDGSAFNFNRWDTANYHSTSHRNCVVMTTDMKWRVSGCDHHHYFLCKRKMIHA
ncbi:aggrecan core protein-like isoform X2 [Ostrea edulis]|uniref:aggrecan core protein-like isoform X2 n=1 Tax=Ostrea edulis TaxID=37623 RepID=UPI0024AFC68A|nr:aggrecan core protein-like isoform X2 [Ostrea edulis]